MFLLKNIFLKSYILKGSSLLINIIYKILKKYSFKRYFEIF